MSASAVTDVLGEPYTCETLTLADDAEGAVVATLVRRPAARPTRKAVLYVHGFSDYFFQTELAQWWTDHDHDFYALDLRKYGRSLRAHQTPAYVESLQDYDEELNLAWQLITRRDQHDDVVLMAHSTGGLVVPLWARANADHLGQLRGLVLNSPWFDLQGPALVRSLPVSSAVTGIGRTRPKTVLPALVQTPYNKSLHVDHGGEFEFDLRWKPINGFPITLGWLAAVRRGHRRLHRGLGITVPCLVLHSGRSATPKRLEDPATHASDIILDVRQIHRWAPALGQHVTEIGIEGGRHDLLLSVPAVRAEVYRVMDVWLRAWL